MSHGDAGDGERAVDDDQDEQRDGDIAGETGSEQTAGPGTHGTAGEFALHPLSGVAREEVDEPEHGHDDDGGATDDAGAHNALGSVKVEHEHEGQRDESDGQNDGTSTDGQVCCGRDSCADGARDIKPHGRAEDRSQTDED